MTTQFVIADNAPQAGAWAMGNHLHPDECRFVHNERVLFGYRNPTIHLLGDYMNNPVLRDICRLFEDREASFIVYDTKFLYAGVESQ